MKTPKIDYNLLGSSQSRGVPRRSAPLDLIYDFSFWIVELDPPLIEASYAWFSLLGSP